MSLQLIVYGKDEEEKPIVLILPRVNAGLTSRAAPQKGDSIIIDGIWIEIGKVEHFYEGPRSKKAPKTILNAWAKGKLTSMQIEILYANGFEDYYSKDNVVELQP